MSLRVNTSVQGPGTQIRRGVKIHRFDSLGSVDAARLRQLFRASGPDGARALAVLDAPPGAQGPALAAVFVTEDYSGAAVVSTVAGPSISSASHSGSGPERPPAAVLVGMALSPLAYAEGTETALWAETLNAFPGVCWLAPPSLTLASAAAMVQRLGPAVIPETFPPLSVDRSGLHAAGQQRLPGSSRLTAMWAGTTTAEHALAALSALRLAPQSEPLSSLPKPVFIPAAGSASGKATRVGLLGARGFTGREFVRLLAEHPELQIVCASSRALVGQDALQALGVPEATAAVSAGLVISDVGPDTIRCVFSLSFSLPLPLPLPLPLSLSLRVRRERGEVCHLTCICCHIWITDRSGAAPDVDVWVLALPNGLCVEHAAAIEHCSRSRGVAPPLLLDLSADMRFDRSGDWTYGLPERPGARAALRSARKISNPGCYATGSQLALLPLLSSHSGGSKLAWDASMKPHVFGVSGYSGAGTTPSKNNDPARLR
jgi:hypothetical protein